MAKKVFVAPPLLLYREKMGLNKFLFWGLFGFPGFYYFYLFFRQIVICTDRRYISNDFWISVLLFFVMGLLLPWIVRKYCLTLELYSDGVYVMINWIREEDMAMRFKNLAFYSMTKTPREFLRVGKDAKIEGKFRSMLLTGFKGVLLINKDGGQFMVPTNDPTEVSKIIERKHYLI